MELKRRI